MSNKQSRSSASKRQAVKEERLKKERQQRLRLIIVIVGIAVLAISLIAAVRFFTTPANQPVVEITPSSRPMADRNNMGDSNAPVQIVEFSDYQCPYCKQFADNTEAQIVENFVSTGKVYFTYRSMGNFVSENIRKGGSESRQSAEASYCAADQNMFWEYKEALFANWLGEDVGSYTDQRLIDIAKSIGLDVEQFSDCYNNRDHQSQVEQDYRDGIASGVTGTPSFLINGKLIKGAQPISVFQAEIEAAIAAAGGQ